MGSNLVDLLDVVFSATEANASLATLVTQIILDVAGSMSLQNAIRWS